MTLPRRNNWRKMSIRLIVSMAFLALLIIGPWAICRWTISTAFPRTLPLTSSPKLNVVDVNASANASTAPSNDLQ